MPAQMMIGDVDLTDHEAYQWTQGDDGEGWEESTAPVRFAPTVDTMIVSRSNKINDVLTFFVVCHGEDADEAEANFQALRDEVEAARLYWVTRGQQGAQKTVVKALEGQTTPLVWTIKTYRLHRVNHAWGSLGLVPCQLVLTVVEGIVPLTARLGFVRTQVLLPDLIVDLEGTGATLGPLAVSVTQPELIVDIGSPSGTATLGPLAVEVVQNDLAVEVVTPSLLLDFDVDRMGLSDGVDIDTFLDYAGAGHDATSVVSHKPVNHTGGPNGKAYASFDGSQIAKTVDTDCLPIGTDERILFLVFRTPTRTPLALNIVSYGQTGSTNAHYSMGTEGGNDNVKGYFWTNSSSAFSVGDISEWHAVALQLDSSGNPRWWIDGSPQSPDSALFPNTGAGVFALGGRDGIDGEFVGDIARIKGYSARTDGEIGDVFDELATEYAL